MHPRQDHVWDDEHTCIYCGVGSSVEQREVECPVRLRAVLDERLTWESTLYLSLGSSSFQKIKAIKALRYAVEPNNLGLMEAKLLLDRVEAGEEVSFTAPADKVDQLQADLKATGLQVRELHLPKPSEHALRVWNALQQRPELFKEIRLMFGFRDA